MGQREFKLELIEALRNRGVFFTQVNSILYRTRCPSCGDSAKNYNTGHLYIWIDPNTNTPVSFYCHKCPYRGIMTKEDLELFGFDSETLVEGLSNLNKNAKRIDKKNVSGKKEVRYNLTIPDIDIQNPKEMEKLQYVNNRLGLDLSPEEAKELKVITNFRKFIMDNKIEKITVSKVMARILHEKYVGFLTSRGSHILFRDITGAQELRWVKYNIFGEVSKEGASKNFYAVPSEVDVLSNEHIDINLAEGVMDILSVVYNIGYDRKTSLNFAVGGKYYSQMILSLINLGLVGDNITVNIFADNDKTYDTSPSFYAERLRKFKPIFGEINVYYNRKSKDVGVPKGEISLNRYKL